MPFGEVRSGIGPVTETDFGYTGQRDLGGGTDLMDYNARFLNPSLSRFTQPDTIIPNPMDPQTLNRYTYTLNNPVKYNDPSGHYLSDGSNDGGGGLGFCDIYPDDPSCQDDEPVGTSSTHTPTPGIVLIPTAPSGTIPTIVIPSPTATPAPATIPNPILPQPPVLDCVIDSSCPENDFYSGGLDPFLSLGVDIIGLAADVESLLIGDPFFQIFATSIEVAWATSYAAKGEVDSTDSFLFMEQAYANTQSIIPLVGAGYSLWGIVLSLEEIVEGFR